MSAVPQEEINEVQASGSKENKTTAAATVTNSIIEELQKSMQDLKTFSIAKHCKVGNYLDVQDRSNNWCVGKIINIDEKGFMTIRFDGWQSKYNEIHFANSKKVEPFRRKTIPYTGRKNPTRDEFTTEKLREEKNYLLEEMSQLRNDEFNVKEQPYAFIQQFRGKFFIIIDTILSEPRQLTEESTQEYVEFFCAFIHLFIIYIGVLPNYLPTYIEAMSMQRSLYLVNTKVAVVSAFPEFFALINALFGGDPRCSKFFMLNRFEFNEYSDPWVIKSIKDGGVSLQVLNFLNYFGQLHGFDALLNLISWENRVSADYVQYTPLLIVKCILEILDKSLPLMPKKKGTVMGSTVRTKAITRMLKINDKEIKDIDFGVVKSTLEVMCNTLAKVLDQKTIEQDCEKLEVSLVLKLLKSPFLEKKIYAISLFKDIFQKARHAAIGGTKMGITESNIVPFKYFDAGLLKVFLDDEGLLDILLGENFHSEVFKRSIDVLQFFYEENAFTAKHLEKIWRATENKHESDLGAIYSIIIDLSKILNDKSLDQLFRCIASLPYEQYSEMTVNLLKQFTLNASQQLNPVQTQYQKLWKSKVITSQEFPYFGLSRLWGAVQDNNKAPNQLVSVCIQALSELFKISYFADQKEIYLASCFDNIKSGQSVPQSIQLAIILLKTYANGTGRILGVGDLSIDDILNKFNKESPLIDAIAKDFEHYLFQVRQKISKQNNTNSNQHPLILDEKQGDEVFVGKCGHSQNIDIRLEFISFMGRYRDKEINVEQIKKLWVILVLKNVTSLEKTRFLAWLIKKR